MKLLVLGATGKTGQLVLAAAARAGHTVTVLVRDPARLPSTDGLKVVTGNATSADDLTRALAGQDAVIGVVGGGYSTTSTVASGVGKAIASAAAAAKGKRIVVLSALGAGESREKCSPLQKIAFGTVMNAVYNDKAVGDAALRASDLDYTIVQPVTFSEKRATGHVTLTDLADLKPMRGFPRVPRADVAEKLVAIAGGADWSRKTVAVTPARSSKA
jgi:uncharacterized protein YbjT (DUF2867 family)